jgi:hypothetical protein
MVYFRRWRIWVVRRKIKQNTNVSVEWVAFLLLIREGNAINALENFSCADLWRDLQWIPTRYYCRVYEWDVFVNERQEIIKNCVLLAGREQTMLACKPMGFICNISLHLLSVNVTPHDNITEIGNSTPKKWLSTCFVILLKCDVHSCAWYLIGIRCQQGEPSLP